MKVYIVLYEFIVSYVCLYCLVYVYGDSMVGWRVISLMVRQPFCGLWVQIPTRVEGCFDISVTTVPLGNTSIE